MNWASMFGKFAFSFLNGFFGKPEEPEPAPKVLSRTQREILAKLEFNGYHLYAVEGGGPIDCLARFTDVEEITKYSDGCFFLVEDMASFAKYLIETFKFRDHIFVGVKDNDGKILYAEPKGILAMTEPLYGNGDDYLIRFPENRDWIEYAKVELKMRFKLNEPKA